MAATIPPMAPPDTPPLLLALVAESELGTGELLLLLLLRVLLGDAPGTTNGGRNGLSVAEGVGNEAEDFTADGLADGSLLATAFFVVVVVGLGVAFLVVVKPTELSNRLVVVLSSTAAAAAAGFLVVVVSFFSSFF